jgi:hypothetical protein
LNVESHVEVTLKPKGEAAHAAMSAASPAALVDYREKFPVNRNSYVQR